MTEEKEVAKASSHSLRFPLASIRLARFGRGGQRVLCKLSYPAGKQKVMNLKERSGLAPRKRGEDLL